MNLVLISALVFSAFISSFADDRYCENYTWLKFKNNCYSFEKERLSYYDAEDFCRSKGAHLVSIHSEDENQFILETLQKRYGGRRWMGLTAIDFKNDYRWSDDSAVDYTKIAPKTQYVKEKCHIFMSEGWRPEHCELRYTAICKKFVNDVTPSPLPPITTIAPEGNCLAGWLQFGQKCYKFYGAAESERLQYREAKQACISLGDDHDLVSIHSMEEQAFLAQHLAAFGTSVWIGLTHIDSDEIGHISVFGWTDNSRVDFTNWAAGHPKPGTWKYCVRLSYDGLSKGQWLSDYCAIGKYGYVCSSPPLPNLPTQPPKPSECEEGSTRYLNSCYRYHSTPETWAKAEEICKADNSHVVSIVDGLEENFLYSLINKESAFVWNGLKTIENTAIFQWVDKQPFYYSKWASGQPTMTIGKPSSCVFMSAITFEWNVTSCEEKLPFVCKISDDKPPSIPPLVVGKCDTKETQLFDIGDNYCYHIGSPNNRRLQWGTLSRYCMSKGMEMISVHSEHQMKSLITYVWRNPYNYWLGLIRSFDKESFMWTDGSSVTYTNWKEREPRQYSENLDCVGFSTEDSKWSVEDCSNWLGGICRVKKVISSGSDQHIARAVSGIV